MKKRKLCGTNLYRRFLGSLLAIGLAVLALNGCGLEGHFSRVVFTTGFGRDEVFRIGRSNCTLPEFMVYLVNTQNQYENVYGEQIWSVELDGVTLEDNVKDTVLAKLAQIKTMYLMAKDRDMELDQGEKQRVEETARTYYESLTDRERQVMGVDQDGVTLEDNVKDTVLAKLAQIKTMYLMAKDRDMELDQGEKQRVEETARTYYESLTDRERQVMGVDQDTIRQLYTEYAMAEKVYNQIIEGINPEISDDEARTITVEHILIRTYTTDGTGKRIDYSESMKQECYDQIEQLREQAVNEEEDFAELAAKYSEDENLRFSFRKGEIDPALEEVAFKLGNGEISDVVELDDGYHLLRCVSTFDREETDANKLKIVEERQGQVFGGEYDAFVETLVRSMNEELWQEIALVHDQEISTDDFFALYEQMRNP